MVEPLLRVAWCVVVVAVAAAVARAQSAPEGVPAPLTGPRAVLADPGVVGRVVELTLVSGDILRARVLAADATTLTIDHPDLGGLTISTERIVSARVVDADPEAAGPPEAPPPVVVQSEGSEATSSAEPPAPSEAGVWDRRLEFGLSGSSGNSDRTTLRFAFDGSWTKPDQILRFNALYLLNVNSGDRTQNRFESTARNEWIKAGTRWRLFLEGGFEYDEFQDYDARARIGGGVAYKFIMNEKTDLLGRAGVGASMEFGGPNDGEPNPELIFGLDLTHKLNDTQRLVASAELFPSLRDTGEYRAVLRAAWEMRVDAERRMSLRIGAENRYNSMTEDSRKNDLEYFASLVWSF